MANDEDPRNDGGADGDPTGRRDRDRRADTRDVDVIKGDAVVPDADQAPDKDELKPEDPPASAPAEGDPNKASAVAAPVPAHGEMASREQIQEATRAAQEEDSEA